MSLHVLGGLCVITAVIGGGLQIADVLQIPQLSKAKLIALGITGALFIVIGVTLEVITDHQSSNVTQTQEQQRG